MLKTGDVLDLGPLGARFIVKKLASETDNQSFEMEWELSPGSGGTPIHIHPNAIETYEVLEGQLDVYVDGEWKTLTKGESVAVDKETPHTFRNSRSEITRIYNTHQPAMRFDEFFEGLYKVVNSGVIKSNKMTLKAIIHVAVLWTNYKEEIRSVNPPYPVMVFFSFIGKLLGYQKMLP